MQCVLLKLTGEILRNAHDSAPFSSALHIAQQIHALHTTHQFALVIGGGNLVRGSALASSTHISEQTAHYTGMLATVMNALVLQDLLHQCGSPSLVVNAFNMPQLTPLLSPAELLDAWQSGTTLIFAGGTGQPFVTTDSCAILRALQLGVSEVWKATNVDGVYNVDPRLSSEAVLFDRISYSQALNQNLAIFDAAALKLAQQRSLMLRVFNAFTPQCLHKAADTSTPFGTTITLEELL